MNCILCKQPSPIVWHDWVRASKYSPSLSINLCFDGYVFCYPEEKADLLRKCLVCSDCQKKFIPHWNRQTKCGCWKIKQPLQKSANRQKSEPQTKLLEVLT